MLSLVQLVAGTTKISFFEAGWISLKMWQLVNEQLRGADSQKSGMSLARCLSSSASDTANTFNMFFAQFSNNSGSSGSLEYSLDGSTLASAYLPSMTNYDLRSIV